MRGTAVVFLVVAAVAAVALSGCRAEDEGRLSKDEFLRRANAICKQSSAATAAIAPPSLADPVAVERAIGEVVRIQRRALRNLRKLEPPARDEPGVEEWLHNIELTVDQMDAVRAALRDGDLAAVNAANAKGDERNEAAEEFADAYGLTPCSTSTDELERQ